MIPAISPRNKVFIIIAAILALAGLELWVFNGFGGRFLHPILLFVCPFEGPLLAFKLKRALYDSGVKNGWVLWPIAIAISLYFLKIILFVLYIICVCVFFGLCLSV